MDALGIRSEEPKLPGEPTFIIDPHNIIQHVSVNNLNVGRNPTETLKFWMLYNLIRLCPCNRPVGGSDTI